MKTKLEWAEKDGIWNATSFGFLYYKWKMLNTHYWAIKIVNPNSTFIGDTNGMSEEVATMTIQSHHDAVCKTVEEALNDERKKISCTPKWISIIDNIPLESFQEEEDRHKFWFVILDHDDAIFKCHRQGSDYYDVDGFKRFPTHWMPLPEPPK